MLFVSSFRTRNGAAAPPGGGDPYILDPTFDLNQIPWHVAGGDYGPQRTTQEVTLPDATTEVTVTTWTDFRAQMLLGNRIITIGADINGSGGVIGGSVVNVVVIIPPGRTLRSFNIGNYLAGHVCQRVLFRGNTLGVHSGGTLHNVISYADPSDVAFDGIDMTGPGVVANASPPPDWIQQSAFAIGTGATGNRIAFNKVRGMCGNYFFIGVVRDLIVTNSSFYTGAEARRSSGTEGWVFRVVGAPGASDHVFWNNDLRGSRFHKLRFHPDGTESRAWIGGGYMVDMNEARLMTVSQTLVTAPKGYMRALVVDGVQCWTDINDPPNAGPDFSSNSAAYVRFRNLTFRSDELTSNASLGISDGGNGGAPDVPIPDGLENWDKVNNTFLPASAEPAWFPATPGSPLSLNWNIGA